MPQLYTIGIIGGADGPTAIYLSAKPTTAEQIALGVFLAAAAAAILFVRKRKKCK